MLPPNDEVQPEALRLRQFVVRFCSTCSRLAAGEEEKRARVVSSDVP